MPSVGAPPTCRGWDMMDPSECTRGMSSAASSQGTPGAWPGTAYSCSALDSCHLHARPSVGGAEAVRCRVTPPSWVAQAGTRGRVRGVGGLAALPGACPPSAGEDSGAGEGRVLSRSSAEGLRGLSGGGGDGASCGTTPEAYCSVAAEGRPDSPSATASRGRAMGGGVVMWWRAADPLSLRRLPSEAELYARDSATLPGEGGTRGVRGGVPGNSLASAVAVSPAPSSACSGLTVMVGGGGVGGRSGSYTPPCSTMGGGRGRNCTPSCARACTYWPMPMRSSRAGCMTLRSTRPPPP